jgi:hypothetical protein
MLVQGIAIAIDGPTAKSLTAWREGYAEHFFNEEVVKLEVLMLIRANMTMNE